jgi:hypothetical protein
MTPEETLIGLRAALRRALDELRAAGLHLHIARDVCLDAEAVVDELEAAIATLTEQKA